MPKNAKHTYYNINATSQDPSAQTLWAAVEAERAAKTDGDTSAIKLARQTRLNARQAFLDTQATPIAEQTIGQKTFVRYAKSLAAAAQMGHSPHLANIIAPARHTPPLPVFKPTALPTTAQQIDLWLAKQQNTIKYLFQDKRFDARFYQDLQSAKTPVTMAQTTENYAQQLTVSFGQKMADLKTNLSAMGANFLQVLKKPAYVALAALPILASVASYGSDDRPTTTTNNIEKTYNSINTANDALKDFTTYKDFVLGCDMPEGFTPSDENIETLYKIIHNESPGFDELPTTGGKYDSKKYPKKRRGNGGGASGAYQLMASTMTRLDVVKRVGKVKFKPSEAHRKADAYNKKAQAENGDTMLLPTVTLKGTSTGTCIKVKLSEQSKTQLGSNCPMDLYNTYNGAQVQTTAALKLYAEAQTEITKKLGSKMGKEIKVKTKQGYSSALFTPQTLIPSSWYNGVARAIEMFKHTGQINVKQYAKMHLFSTSDLTTPKKPPAPTITMRIDSNALYIKREHHKPVVLQPQ